MIDHDKSPSNWERYTLIRFWNTQELTLSMNIFTSALWTDRDKPYTVKQEYFTTENFRELEGQANSRQENFANFLLADLLSFKMSPCLSNLDSYWGRYAPKQMVITWKFSLFYNTACSDVLFACDECVTTFQEQLPLGELLKVSTTIHGQVRPYSITT